MRHSKRFFSKSITRLCFAVVVGVAGYSQPLSAQQSSSLITTHQDSQHIFDHSTVRLIIGEYNNKAWTAGVEIELAPGWKTYWRVPGDSGVPAEFDWTNSTNVKTTKVFWPAPKRYEDITGKSIGYKKHVVFPVTVTPENTDAPAKLDLQFYYAVCNDICIPAQANLKLNLPIKTQSNMSLQRIRSFEAQVPKASESAIHIVETKAILINKKPVLSVKISGKVAEKTDILVEGFDAAFFESPQSVSTKNGEHLFHLPIDGIEKPGELTGKTLKLTILSGDVKFEKSIQVN